MKHLSFLFFAIFGVALMATAAPKNSGKNEPAKPTLEIKSNVDGAEVIVDGKTVGTTPLSEGIVVEAGKHTVKVKKKGFSDFADVVTASPSKPTIVKADLLAVAGYLRVTTEDKEKAQVYLDGKFLGDTPYEGEIPIGQHDLEVRRLGYFDFRNKFAATGGKEFPFQAPLQKLPTDLNPLEKKKPLDAIPFFQTPFGKVLLASAVTTAASSGTFGGFKIWAVGQKCSTSFFDVSCRDEFATEGTAKR